MATPIPRKADAPPTCAGFGRFQRPQLQRFIRGARHRFAEGRPRRRHVQALGADREQVFRHRAALPKAPATGVVIETGLDGMRTARSCGERKLKRSGGIDSPMPRALMHDSLNVQYSKKR
jgi:hypothetical protein